MIRVGGRTRPREPVSANGYLARLFRVCDGKDFRDRRDLAILRLLWDTGMRISELTGLDLDHLDLDQESQCCARSRAALARAAPVVARDRVRRGDRIFVGLVRADGRADPRRDAGGLDVQAVAPLDRPEAGVGPGA